MDALALARWQFAITTVHPGAAGGRGVFVSHATVGADAFDAFLDLEPVDAGPR